MNLGKVGDFLFGSGDKVSAPYESDYARKMREALEGKIYGGLNNYDPTAIYQQGQDAYNSYNTNMQAIMNGQLPTAYTDQLNSIRDNNLSTANRQIQEAAGLQTGGLLNNLAGRGVLSSSVASNSLGQIGKSAANAMSDAASRENASYSQNYLSSLGSLASMNSGNLGNALNYGGYQQSQLLSPAVNLYGQYNSQQPVLNQGSPGFLTSAGSGLMQGVGMALPTLLSDSRLKEDIKYTGKVIDGCPVATWRWKDGSGSETGFIAQDVAKVHPERVVTGADGYMRIIKSSFSEWPEAL